MSLDEQASLRQHAADIYDALSQGGTMSMLENAQRANDRELEIRQAGLREREACARIAERISRENFGALVANRIADEIRERRP